MEMEGLFIQITTHWQKKSESLLTMEWTKDIIMIW